MKLSKLKTILGSILLGESICFVAVLHILFYKTKFLGIDFIRLLDPFNLNYVYAFSWIALYSACIGYLFFQGKKGENRVIPAIIIEFLTLIIYLILYYTHITLNIIFFLLHYLQFADWLFGLVLFPAVISSILTYFLLPYLSKKKFFSNKSIAISAVTVSLFLIVTSIILYYFENEGSSFVKSCKSANGKQLSYDILNEIGGYVYTRDGYKKITQQHIEELKVRLANPLAKAEITLFENSYSKPHRRIRILQSGRIGWECEIGLDDKAGKIATKSFYYDPD